MWGVIIKIKDTVLMTSGNSTDRVMGANIAAADMAMRTHKDQKHCTGS